MLIAFRDTLPELLTRPEIKTMKGSPNSILSDYMVTIFQDRLSGMDSRQATCLTPVGLMQICSRQICAGHTGRTADLHWPKGQCTRMYIVNPGSMEALSLPSLRLRSGQAMALDTRFLAGMTILSIIWQNTDNCKIHELYWNKFDRIPEKPGWTGLPLYLNVN
jgi:hypothetical protein